MVEFYVLEAGQEKRYDRRVDMVIVAVDDTIIEFREKQRVAAGAIPAGAHIRYANYLQSMLVKKGRIYVVEDAGYAHTIMPSTCRAVQPLRVTTGNTAAWTTDYPVTKMYGWVTVLDRSATPPTLRNDLYHFVRVTVEGVGLVHPPANGAPFILYDGTPRKIAVSVYVDPLAPANTEARLNVVYCFNAGIPHNP